MGKVKRAVYKLYKKLQDNWLIATSASFFYTRIIMRSHRRTSAHLTGENTEKYGLPKVAFVCDEMTWQDFKDECNSVFVTPYDWAETFEVFKPDIFFCESAWAGIAEYKNCWRGRIYKNEKIRYENRRELFKILDYCGINGIPTVFWNKEDPAFFGNKRYDFVDTALHFDHILTTAGECIPWYKKLGHPSVHTMMFGFSPKMFFPDTRVRREKKAVFAGSWYADQPDRCREMGEIFDWLLRKGIPLEIYDRQSGSANPLHRFPEKYRPYLHSSVPFQKLGTIFRGAEYAVNVNTVKNSDTMFARRVFEIMACGCIVISNGSCAIKKFFPNRVWFYNEDFDFNNISAIREQNLSEVFQNHTCACRMKEVLKICGYKIPG